MKNQTVINELRNEINKKINTEMVISISKISRILCVSQRTLRLWDENKLLVPKRTTKNRRNYTKEDIEKGILIIFVQRYLTNKLEGTKYIISNIDKTKPKKKSYTSYINKMIKELGLDIDLNDTTQILSRSTRGRKRNAGIA